MNKRNNTIVQKERYTLAVVPAFADYANNLSKFCKVGFKTLKEAKEYFSILTDSEKEKSYILDNVKKQKVDI